MKKPLKIPQFKNEDEERDFWAQIDLSEYYDADDLEKVSFPNLKPTSRPISIGLPDRLLHRVKEKANELHVPYQSLIKQYIQQGVFSTKYPCAETEEMAQDGAGEPRLEKKIIMLTNSYIELPAPIYRLRKATI